MRRYDSGYQKLKKAIESFEIGDVLMMHCAHRNSSVPESYVTEMAVSDSLVHELDAVRWLLKEDYVSAQMILAKKTLGKKKLTYTLFYIFLVLLYI